MQRDNGGYYDRARQPLGYGGDDRRRGRAAPWPGSDDRLEARQQGRPQQRRDYPVRGEQPRSRERSRLLAVVMLVAVALVIAVAGLTIDGDDGLPGSEAIPFQLLPFPDNAVTSTTQ